MTDLNMLNEQQREVVLNSYDTNTVLVAGAGSGKTATLIARTSYLVEHMNVDPSEIMVVTFTNKAANEIKDRISAVTNEGYKMWLGTFHSICVKILRMYGNEIGIKNFTIMDTYDAKSVLKKTMQDAGLDVDKFLVNKYMKKISDKKSNMIRPQKLLDSATNREELQFAKVYKDYQNITWRRKSFDFDDLIIYAVVLFTYSMAAVKRFHDTVRFFMVDESQDTNTAQFHFIKAIVGANNLLLVGDDDQSIYSFRNAKPEYLLNFQKTYPDAKILKLEQNYRSTKTIIEASNAIVKNNVYRNDKTMVCNNAVGDPIVYHECRNNIEEGKWIATEIRLINADGVDYKDIAILYRTNAQSRSVEEQLMKYNVPFKIVGSIGFYDRKEIKDMLAYCKLIANPDDEISFRRILGLQKGVGKKTVDSIVESAITTNSNFIDIISYVSIPRAQVQISLLKSILVNSPKKPSEFIKYVLEYTGYKNNLLKENTPESQARLENLNELVSIALEYEAQEPNITLLEFVNKISLSSSPTDSNSASAITMMTIHSAKGLEFRYVFIIGVEEKLLPHQNSLNSDKAIEEERRLMYVAATRAKEQLYILNAKERRDFGGNIVTNKKSRFIKEIPSSCMITV